MTRILCLAAILALAACSEPPPPPKPAAAPPKAEAPAPTPAAPAPVVEAPKPDPNKELAQRVKRALESETRIQAAAIDVTAKEGRISLWGTASTDRERALAAQVAGKVEGVSGVENQIKVVKGS